MSMDHFESEVLNKQLNHSIQMVESHDQKIEKVQQNQRYNKLSFDTKLQANRENWCQGSRSTLNKSVNNQFRTL